MHRYDQPRRLLAYGIAGLAGFVDATGFLAADRYFVSFMSGNTTRLGVDLATRLQEAAIPALLIVGFLCGVIIGALVAERSGSRPKTAVLALSAALMIAGAAAHSLGSTTLFVSGSVLAMGAINNAFRRDGEVSVGVTYMTGALVRFGQGIAGRMVGKPLAGTLANLALWSSLAAGAVTGAAATFSLPVVAPWMAVCGALALIIAASRIERRALTEASGA